MSHSDSNHVVGGHPASAHHRAQWAKLALGALGVVYGDIGTSPLYALKECFPFDNPAPGRVPLISNGHLLEANLLGILSLVFWSLMLVVVIKYLLFIMRADNHGEGGIFALLALLKSKREGKLAEASTTLRKRSFAALVLLGLFGAALLYGDGMITPAVSVLSAVEGLGSAPGLHLGTPLVVAITLVILLLLFLFQKRGTHRVGALFGPIMLIWFVTIGGLGLWWILKHPAILRAMNPMFAIRFLVENRAGGVGFLVLGGVVLCITGAEALYADMGHFGKKPIRTAWYLVVFPALILNYFGQGALLLHAPHTAHPFFDLVSGAWKYPLVLISTLAAVVASQALISGAFSITQQAIQLGYLPRMRVIHTWGGAEGQIYIPEINRMLMVACLVLVLAFRETQHLTGAYGIAVTGTMAITSLLFYKMAREHWGWNRLVAGSLVALFLVVDLTFFGANLVKISKGGYVPILVGAGIFAIMTTWHKGRAFVEKWDRESSLPLDLFIQDIEQHPLTRVPGTAIFLARNTDDVPVVLLHHVKHNKVLHERIILLSILTERVPEISQEKRIEIEELRGNFVRVRAHYGFMQFPHLAEILKLCHKKGLKTVLNDTSYYLGRETVLLTGRSRLARWRKVVFAFLVRNARPATEFFGIPPNRVIELGSQIEV